jgi:uncharacterized repeat protein (TIGR01451 family)
MIKFKKLALVFATLSLWLVAGAAHALTPGNTALTNVVKLTYTGNAAGITSTVIVTVKTIGSVPTIVTLLDDVFRAENQSFGGTYSFIATNNGPDVYALSTSFTTTLANTAGAYEFRDAPAGGGSVITSTSLGASAISELTVAGTTFKVPSDGTDDDVVNGLAAGDRVIISGAEYTIAAGGIDDTTSAVFTTITLTAALPASLPLSTGVFETKNVFVHVGNVGTQITAGIDAPVNVTIVVDPTLDSTTATIGDLFVVTIVNVKVDKFVRNTNSLVAGGCTGVCTGATVEVTFNTFDYYASNNAATKVSAKTGDVLEYLVRVTAPNAPLANAVVGDTLADFTAYVPATTTLNTIAVTDGDGTTAPEFPLSPVTVGTDSNGGLLIQDTAQTIGAQGDGNVAGGTTVNIVYRVVLL